MYHPVNIRLTSDNNTAQLYIKILSREMNISIIFYYEHLIKGYWKSTHLYIIILG